MKIIKRDFDENRRSTNRNTNIDLGALLGALCALSLVSACTAGSAAQSQDARLRPYLGQPIEALALALHDMPTMTFDRPGGRVFVFKEVQSGMTPGFYAAGIYVPTVGGTRTCVRTVETHTGESHFIVDSIEAEGC